MELCGGDGCHESEILAFDFQRRAWEYYEAGKMMAHSYHDCMLKANCLSVRKLELSELSELVLCSPCCSYCSTSYCLCVCVGHFAVPPSGEVQGKGVGTAFGRSFLDHEHAS